ncbi:MAG: ribonuclease R [Planctomycetaceae bacterium]|nr:ribonuclease R [Planctomycetaceae bacterium]
MTDTSLEARVLAFVGDPNYRPVKPRVIAERLDLSQEQRFELKKLIKRLIKEQKLAYGPNHLLLTAQAAAQQSLDQVGIFRRNQAGFGFVRPLGTKPTDGQEFDIYIGAHNAADASTGDTVRVRLSRALGGPRDRREGTIVEVIERDTHEFVGTYFESGGVGFVQVDGTLFSQAISVGDPGAKNARPDDKVVFEMVRFPSHVHDGEGVITEVLGPRGTPGVDTLSIIREFALPEEFAEDALEEARLEAEHFDEKIAGQRVDLTGETVITIDPIDARDFDDAISLERIEKNHWRLGVHIADVSHFVRPQTALDREAHNRATSTYLPDRVLPMLPEVISNSLASLQPDRVRYTKTAFLEFTPEGIRVGVELCSAAIRSKRRFTYEEVDEYLADPAGWKSKLKPEVHALLGRMHELAMILRQRRMRRGAIELTMPEVKIDLDKEGRVAGAHRVINTVSHQIIEEFMLAANEAVAEQLFGADLLFLRRVHSAPDPRKLKALTEFVTGLGIVVESLESRFELQKLLERVVGRPEEQAVNYAVLRSFQRAVYSPAVDGHYALASDCYCHFTSPIRRYPDLTIHRLIDSLLTHRKPTNDLAELLVQGEHCSERERRAEAAERELTKVKLLSYLAERPGLELDAVVTSVLEFGMFAQGIELPAEGLIHVSSLADDYYKYDRTAHTLSGFRSGNSYRLGDRIRVAVVRADVERRELDFRVVGRTPGRGAGAQPRGGKKPGQGTRTGARKQVSGGKLPPKKSKSKAQRKKRRK